MSINLENLPIDMSIQIFSHLDPQDLARCEQVSKRLRIISNDKILWEQIRERMFPETAVPSDSSAKKCVVDYIKDSVYSFDEIVARIAKFASKVRLNQIGRFTCAFPKDPECILSVTFGYGAINQYGEPQTKDSYIFRGQLKESNSDDNILTSSDNHNRNCINDVTIILPTSILFNDKNITNKIKTITCNRLSSLQSQQIRIYTIRAVIIVALSILAIVGIISSR